MIVGIIIVSIIDLAYFFSFACKIPYSILVWFLFGLYGQNLINANIRMLMELAHEFLVSIIDFLHYYEATTW